MDGITHIEDFGTKRQFFSFLLKFEKEEKNSKSRHFIVLPIFVCLFILRVPYDSV